MKELDSQTAANSPEGANSMTMRKLHFHSATLGKLGLAGLVLLIPTTPEAIGEASAPFCKSVYQVTGNVRVLQEYSAGSLQDGSKVVVWLVPTQTDQKPRLDTEPPHYRIIQHHKIFEPRLLVVPVGSIVEFPNHDPWFHNVFSVSGSKRFDLGLYEAGVQKAVRFDRPGASYLFCSIHPEMLAVVLAVDSNYFGVSDKTGHISIAEVPPGKYVLHVWYENATPQELKGLRRVIFVCEESRSLPTLSIALSHRIGKNQQPSAD
jgi:plastocyanin